MKETWNGFGLYELIHNHLINRTPWRQLRGDYHLVANGGMIFGHEFCNSSPTSGGNFQEEGKGVCGRSKGHAGI